MLKKIMICLIYSALFYFVAPNWQQLLLFSLGTIVGFGLLFLDQQILHQYYLEGKAKQNPEAHLITRSALFILVLVPLSLFVVTSTMSSIGMGLVMGIWLVLLVEMIEYRQPYTLFEQRFLSETNLNIDQSQVFSIISAAMVVFLILNLLLIFN